MLRRLWKSESFTRRLVAVVTCFTSCGSADGSASQQGMSLLAEPHSKIFFPQHDGERKKKEKRVT